MLEVHNLSAAYGQSEVLHSIDLSAKAGEIVALVGRNGMGKSTLMKSLIGVQVYRPLFAGLRGIAGIGDAGYASSVAGGCSHRAGDAGFSG